MFTKFSARNERLDEEKWANGGEAAHPVAKARQGWGNLGLKEHERLGQPRTRSQFRMANRIRSFQRERIQRECGDEIHW